MESGTLRHVVDLQHVAKTESNYGDETDTWTTYASKVYAAVVPLRGAAFYAAQQINSKVTMNVIIRYRSDVKSGDHVLFEGRTLLVEGPPIDPQMKHRELHLMCSELT